ncbi:hypothetical protein L2E82_37313 [Cichorium intybus]|uniref:Uncharacterized protein n=1 Tax=Cichorium intybus TaxID=13427 RepID=A0ACB9ADU6_CICIN|nr:hypothetical protein L2E82_37313 [Cichorium intybus]
MNTCGPRLHQVHVDYVKLEASLLGDSQSDVEAIKLELEIMRSCIRDAERKQLKSELVETWRASGDAYRLPPQEKVVALHGRRVSKAQQNAVVGACRVECVEIGEGYVAEYQGLEFSSMSTDEVIVTRYRAPY